MARKVSCKYITMLQSWQYGFAEEFLKRNGLKLQPLGYTDSSTTTYTWRVRTAKTLREVQDMAWEINGGGWACVMRDDPRRVGLPS